MRDFPLTCRTGPLFNEAEGAAYARLLSDVLDRDPIEPLEVDDPWMPIALFEPGGRCVGNVDVAILSMIIDAVPFSITAIRSVAVAEAWRGRGLFRQLMRDALVWCDSHAPMTILYTEEPKLYERFGFSSVSQHAFEGPRPQCCAPLPPARILDLDAPDDRALLIGVFERRAWLSQHVALKIDTSTFVRNVRSLDLTIAYADTLAAILIFEQNGDTLCLYDVLAEKIPRLDTVLATLSTDAIGIRVMFPTDQLGWSGSSETEDTGLMLRGERPRAWDQPFMIAPTAEF